MLFASMMSTTYTLDKVLLVLSSQEHSAATSKRTRSLNEKV